MNQFFEEMGKLFPEPSPFMDIHRISPLTGKRNVMTLRITQEQLDLFYSENRPKIQEIFPNLKAEEREFILSGYTPEDWNSLFPEGEE